MKKHILYYVCLLALLVSAVLFTYANQSRQQIQMAIVVGLGIAYVAWGVVHHQLHHSLRAKIVLEYVAVAALGIAIILFIVKSII